MPTDVLNAVYIAELDDESTGFLKPYLGTMAELVRAKTVHLYDNHEEIKAEWHGVQMDEKKVYVAIT
jgi:hypothetical protein